MDETNLQGTIMETKQCCWLAKIATENNQSGNKLGTLQTMIDRRNEIAPTYGHTELNVYMSLKLVTAEKLLEFDLEPFKVTAQIIRKIL